MTEVESSTIDGAAAPTRWKGGAIALQIVTAVCLVATALMTLMLGAVAIVDSDGNDGNRDFIQYWAAGQLLVQGKNPYDRGEILKLERPAGYTKDPAAVSFSPPILFVLIAPLGLVNAKEGAILGCVFLFVCLLAALRLIWASLGKPPTGYFLLAFCFAPVLTCFMAGQIGIVLLLAIAIFLRFHSSYPVVAGVALAACAWKPHLFGPFGLALILWMVLGRRFRLAIGIGVGIAIAVAFSIWIDGHSWSQWVHFMHTVDPPNQFQPTLSKLFRDQVHQGWVWLQFLPEVLASVWSVAYFWRRRKEWDWLGDGLLLLIVSVGCAPYAWLTDESILVPAILAAIFSARAAGRTLLPLSVILMASATILIRGHWMDTLYYLWTTPAYLAWYLYATWREQKVEQPSLAV